MKLALVVLSTGKWEGKVIPITLPQFVIGRDPQCHLRPASPQISKQHCALQIKDGKAFIQDFGSTNGTFLNEQQIAGEVEVHKDDVLKVGPLAFRVNVETTAPVNKPTPLPTSKPVAGGADEESVADMLMSILDEGGPSAHGQTEDVPEGTTVMEAPPLPPGEAPAKDKEGRTKEPGNTSSAAKAILDKYMRRR